MKWLIINYYTGIPSVFSTLEQASQEAINQHKDSGGNPTFTCWEYNGKTCKYVGRLWCEQGKDYDPFNCWKV